MYSFVDYELENTNIEMVINVHGDTGVAIRWDDWD